MKIIQRHVFKGFRKTHELQNFFVHKEEYYCLEDWKWPSGDCSAQALNPSIVLLFKEKPWDLHNSTTTSLSCYQDKMIRCIECAVHVLQTILHIESLSKLLWVHGPSAEFMNNQMCIYICFLQEKIQLSVLPLNWLNVCPERDNRLIS